MSVPKIKLIVSIVWIIFGIALFSTGIFSPVNSQTTSDASIKTNNSALNPGEIVERFDKSLQQRFLTEPFFGIRRIQPVAPTNPHFEYFSPKNDEEKASVSEFEKQGLNVGVYLFGKRTTPKKGKGDKIDGFSVNYRLFNPIPITADVKKKNLRPPEKLLRQVKKAFLEFQTPNGANENEYVFNLGKWTYIAKPVRAVNQSCLKCHQDYVAVAKFSSGKYRFRKRRIGDANGILVYGFSKKD
jgi:hypothetical protein